MNELRLSDCKYLVTAAARPQSGAGWTGGCRLSAQRSWTGGCRRFRAGGAGRQRVRTVVQATRGALGGICARSDARLSGDSPARSSTVKRSGPPHTLGPVCATVAVWPSLWRWAQCVAVWGPSVWRWAQCVAVCGSVPSVWRWAQCVAGERAEQWRGSGCKAAESSSGHDKGPPGRRGLGEM